MINPAMCSIHIFFKINTLVYFYCRYGAAKIISIESQSLETNRYHNYIIYNIPIFFQSFFFFSNYSTQSLLINRAIVGRTCCCYFTRHEYTFLTVSQIKQRVFTLKVVFVKPYLSLFLEVKRH